MVTSFFQNYYRKARRDAIIKLVPSSSRNAIMFIENLDKNITDLEQIVSHRSGSCGSPNTYCKVSDSDTRKQAWTSKERERPTPYLILDLLLDYSRDVIGNLKKIRNYHEGESRIIISTYSRLWHPLIKMCEIVAIKSKGSSEASFISTSNLDELAFLSGFQLLHRTHNLIIPVPIPFVSKFINRFIAPLPIFRLFCSVTISIYKPLPSFELLDSSLSIVIAARNEEENILPLLRKIPRLASRQEVIVVEGNSKDYTWSRLESAVKDLNPKLNLTIAKQEGLGKANAIHKAIELSQNEIIMILDADISVDPEELIHFYDALRSGIIDFGNGTRFIYPVEEGAIRFLNLLGNKFFTLLLTFLLGQRVTDTLCGTKAFWRRDYVKMSRYISSIDTRDPFGDFKLLFGALHLHLKICNIPVNYKARIYGETNISRFRDGITLLKFIRELSLSSRFI